MTEEARTGGGTGSGGSGGEAGIEGGPEPPGRDRRGVTLGVVALASLFTYKWLFGLLARWRWASGSMS